MDDNEKIMMNFPEMFSGGVFDMKNSMNMLINSMEELIVDTPPSNEKQALRLASMQYEVSRINGEINKLMTLHHLQESNARACPEEHFVIDMLNDQLAQNDMLFHTQRVKIAIDCDEDLEWYYDNTLVSSVLNNVLIQSARYCRTRLELSAKVEDKKLIICIADDGQGFPDSMLNVCKVLDEQKKYTGSSAHLNLLYAFQIASLHEHNQEHGTIEMNNNSKLGGGVFSLVLP
jgi:K+-sensing histidine kinase KdpD